jgi:radical SAM protein with 4Fe4S-binding SPASM domain
MKLLNPEVRIETTNRCQARCVFCPRDKLTRPLATMSDDHFQSLVLQCQDLGATTISLFGFGEPLLDPDIVRKIQFCTDLGLDTFITTNAGLLDLDMTYNILEAGLTHIRFSFSTLRYYEDIHRGLKPLDVLRNIGNFIQVNKQRFAKRCKVSMSFTVMFDENVKNIRETWESKIDWLEVWKPHNWGQGRTYRPLTDKRKLRCPRPYNGPLQIQVDGTVIPCCFLTNSELILGDTYKNTVKEILEGEAYQALRLRHNNADLSGLPCETCDQLNIEDEKPLLYSSRDPERNIDTTSGIKFKLEE